MIDNAQALPLYHQVAGVLRQRIEDGIYPVGGKLLSEDELATEFEVSRATIRQAVGELVIEGLVVRRQGRGTYVEARDTNVLQQRFRGSLGDLINESQRAKTRNVDVAHDVPIPRAHRGGAAAGQPARHDRQAHPDHGRPAVRAHDHLPAAGPGQDDHARRAAARRR